MSTERSKADLARDRRGGVMTQSMIADAVNSAVPSNSPPMMPPGRDPHRMLRLMKNAIAECDLNLSGYTVVTEAASGPYIVTPIMAAMAGAQEVIAVTRTSKYGRTEDIERDTMKLARLAGVPSGTISIFRDKDPSLLGRADIVTNSGHLRPLDAETIRCLKRSAVVPLMFEAWEIKAGRFDVDLDELHARGIAAAGTNERHPNIGVFSYLSLMATKLLLEAGIPPLNSTIAILCDNPFGDYLRSGLERAGAVVCLGADLPSICAEATPDALLVAQVPRWETVISSEDALWLAEHCPGTVVAQFWGDIDRAVLSSLNIPYWPPLGPLPGHMAVLPSDVGIEPVIRLQVGGLKVGEVLLKPAALRSAADMEYVDAI